MQLAVQQAISSMRARYYDPITLKELAAEVFVSPFHFSRVFTRSTGVTPGRYLTAIRLFEAKRLLLTTSLTVSDIVCGVGYSSVGTFTSRFTRAVGMTPSQYRDPAVRELLVAAASDFHRMPSLDLLRDAERHPVPAPRQAHASISGTMELPPEATPANVLVGVFAESIPQCGPVAYEYRHNVGSSRIEVPNVPAGHWVVIAVAEHRDSPREGAAPLGVVWQRVTVAAGRPARVHLRMRGLRPADPPFAITLASLSTSSGLDIADRRPALRAVA